MYLLLIVFIVNNADKQKGSVLMKYTAMMHDAMHFLDICDKQK